MKALMFGWEFPPFISGGLGTACYGITKGLINNGVDVTFVVPTKQNKTINSHVNILAADEIILSDDFSTVMTKNFTQKNNLSKQYFNISPYYTNTVYYNDFFEKIFSENDLLSKKSRSLLSFTGNYGKDLYFEVGRYSLIARYLALKQDFDIIHAHDWLTYPAGIEAKQFSNKPLVIHVHATEFDRSGDNINSDVYNIEKKGMQFADRIVAVSQYTKKRLVEKYGINPDKIDVVHNAVSKEKQIERLHIKKSLNEKIVLFLGRVTMQKGPDYFIEAANIVLKKTKKVRFVMAGSGDMLPRMITRAAELRISDRFHFVGFLDRLKVETIYAMSDLYVMPSVSEPFGITPFEALLYDVPIIISKHSGVAEILTNAVMIDFWDVQKLAKEIITLTKNEKKSKTIIQQCKERIKKIEWNTAGFKLKEIYKNILNRRGQL